MRALLALVLLPLGVARAQVPPVRIPHRGVIAVEGRIVRSREFGCSRGWSTAMSWTDVTLSVDARDRASVGMRGRIHRASGGLGLLGDERRWWRQAERETRHVEWSGRAIRRSSRVTIRLRSLTETIEPLDPPAERLGPTVTRENGELECRLELRPVFAADRPVTLAGENPIGRRAVFVCRFAGDWRRGPAPRPVAELVTVPFFLAEDAGVTTDAMYGEWPLDAPRYLVARAPGGLPAPF